jgi:hypothetical protein
LSTSKKTWNPRANSPGVSRRTFPIFEPALQNRVVGGRSVAHICVEESSTRKLGRRAPPFHPCVCGCGEGEWMDHLCMCDIFEVNAEEMRKFSKTKTTHSD